MPSVDVNNKLIENHAKKTSLDRCSIVCPPSSHSSGAIVRTEVKVKANTKAPYVLLDTNITSGIAPFKSYFSVVTNIPNTGALYGIDFEGDGTDDYSSETFENVAHVYGGKGIHFPVIHVTDD